MTTPSYSKLLPLPEACGLRESLRRRGGTLVFTNGCFDLLHPGHLDYLARARGLGTALYVGLNSDASVRRLGKGPERPVCPEGDRALMLSGLSMIDAVIIFDEDTPLELIRRLEPDVLVKGGDWRQEDIVGSLEVLTRGGRVHSLPLLPGYSTTSLVERIRGSGGTAA
ncbi:MAG: D-glycero-beta-D-manno-heptose 1-phosphate adenylyltransferase [Deltaproteobacteria bacterium]|jgi:rfaE bifunctional protein nucleotidyltransferase chain/domain|nr:D-glycero-beta-D-manno-heptose 1-phosphate adenylyltransferase [Deltaproteobacteria bacterium]